MNRVPYFSLLANSLDGFVGLLVPACLFFGILPFLDEQAVFGRAKTARSISQDRSLNERAIVLDPVRRAASFMGVFLC